MDVGVRAVLSGFPEAQRQVDGLAGSIGKLSTDGVDRLKTSSISATAANDKFVTSLGGMRSVINSTAVALGIVGGIGIGSVALFGKSLFEAGTQIEKFRISMNAAAGSAREGASNFQFVQRLSNEMGVSFTETAQAFQKFSAAAMNTGLEGAKAREIFTSFAGAARVLGLTAGETSGMFMALEQMISKGRISMEELRRQLGDRLPGAFRLAAESMGMTTAALEAALAAGTITAEEFLPKLAARVKEVYGDAVPTAAKTAQAELARLNNEWTLLMGNFANNSGFMTAAGASIGFVAAHVRKLGEVVKEETPAMERFWRLTSILPGLPGRAGGWMAESSRRGRLLSDQSTIDSETQRLLGRAPAPTPSGMDDFWGAFSDPTSDDINAFNKREAKRLEDLEKAKAKAMKEAEEIAKAQMTWEDMAERDRREASEALANQERKNARERREQIDQTTRAFVQSAKIMEERSESLVYTWDQFGNRITMSKADFASMDASMAAIFGAEGFQGLSVLGGTHRGLAGEINETLRGNQGLVSLAKNAGQVLIDEMTREVSRNISRELLKPFKSTFEKIGEVFSGVLKDIFGDVFSSLTGGFSGLSNALSGIGGSLSGIGSSISGLLGSLGITAGIGGGIADIIAHPRENLFSFISTGFTGFGSILSGLFPTGTAGSVYTSPSLIMVGDAGPEMVSVSPLGGAAHGGRGGGGVTINVNGLSMMDAYQAKRLARVINGMR